ncbi:MAG: nucleotidyltransferase substrate binding protein [Candidatus Protochlamydia sp.]|nr:nucleotidyltransferase substrate binding protein [Candidatus Protochlamydia sp.]
MNNDIRWKQRFQNFQKAFLFLQRSAQLGTYDELQSAGLVQSFEFTFELAWKTLKDYLEAQGMTLQFPREVIKQAFSGRLIEDGRTWIKMLDKRNELTHTYNEKQAKQAVETIRNDYFPAIEQVYHTLKEKCSD